MKTRMRAPGMNINQALRIGWYKKIITVLLCCFLLSPASLAATKTWTGAVNSSWGDSGNWSPAGVPTGNDTVFFVGGANNVDCNVDVPVVVFGIISALGSGFNKTITQLPGNSITVLSNASPTLTNGIRLLSACSFIGSTANDSITTNGPLMVQNGASFTSTKGTLSVRNDFNFPSVSTFTHNNGRVIFTFPQNIYGNSTFYILDFSPTGGSANFELNGNSLVVEDTLFFSNVGPISLNNGSVRPRKDIVVTNSYNGNSGAGAIILSTAGTQTIWGISGGLGGIIGVGGLNSINISKAPTDTVFLKGTVNISRDNSYYSNSGVIISTGAKLVLSGNTAITGGASFPYIEHLVLYPLHFAFDIQGSNYVTVQNLTFAAGLTYIAVNVFGGTNAIHVKDSLIIQNQNSTCVRSPGPIIMNGTGNQHIFGNALLGTGIMPTIIIDKPGTTLFLQNNISLGVDWILQAGTIDPGTSSVAFMGDNNITGSNLVFNNMYLWGCSSTLQEFTFNNPVTARGNVNIQGGFAHVYTNNSVHAKRDIFLNNTALGGSGSTIFFVDTTINQFMYGNAGIGQGRLPNVIINKSAGTLTMKDSISISGNWEYRQGTVDATTFNSYVTFYNDSALDGQGITDTMLFNTIRLGDNKTRTMLGDLRVKILLQLDAGTLKLNGNNLSIENTNPSTITSTAGYIISEDTVPQGLSFVKWDIQNSGTGNNYVIPFGRQGINGGKTPFVFNIQSAGIQSGTGNIAVATYQTDPNRLVNNRPLPPGVTNTQDFYGLDNDCRLVDRYWIMEANNYTTNPKANLSFSYLDYELGGTNCLDENLLETQRWNVSNNIWNLTGGTRNIVTNSVALSNVDTFGTFALLDPNPPDLAITALDTLICIGDSIDFCVYPFNGAGANSYLWSFQGGIPSTLTDSCPTNIIYSSNGIFSVTLTAAFANVTITSVYPDYIKVGLSSTLTSTNVSCFGGNDGTLSVNVFSGTSPYSYQWSNGTTSQTINNLSAGIYTVTVTDAAGCLGVNSTTILQPPAITATFSSTNVSCNGLSNGTITATVAGGTAPYVYFWSTGSTGAIINNLSPANYSLTIVDNNNCTASASASITQPPPFSYLSIVNDVPCPGINTGSINGTIFGGTPPYSYSWSNGSTTEDIIGLSAGIYFVTITDNNFCSYTTSDTIKLLSNLSLQATSTDVLCFGDAAGTATINVSGGQAPFSYSWSNGDTSTSISNLAAGTYTATITDASGCTVTASVNIAQPQPILFSVNSTALLCPGSNSGNITLTTSGGTPPYFYLWSNGMTGSNISGLSAGNYSVTASDANACTRSGSIDIGLDTTCVWPGDANYDGVANNFDILSIGVAYGTTGPLRTNATLNWMAQPAPDWLYVFANGVNYKQADCNGDSIINANDTLAISLNYGLTHAKTSGGGSSAGPCIYIELPDTLWAGQSYSVPVILGNTTNLAIDLYGIAFSILYGNDVVDSNSVSISYNNSWMGTPGVNLLGFSKDFYPSSKTDVGITRTDHLNLLPNSGPIAYFSFTIKDDVSGIIFNPAIDNILAIDKDENMIIICVETDSSLVFDFSVGTKQQKVGSELKIYPNPSHDKLYIRSELDIKMITLFDIAGKMLLTETPVSPNHQIDLKEFASGCYLLKIKFDNIEKYHRIFIEK